MSHIFAGNKSPAAEYRTVGKTQTLEVAITCAANAVPVTIATVTTQPCLIKSIVLHAVAAQTVDLTNIICTGGSGSVVVFIDAVTGLRANLDAADKQIAWMGAVRLPIAATITVDPTGSGPTALNMIATIEYEACINDGYLA